MLSDSDFEELNRWLDQFNLSRPKRNISKDFSDGVLIAEILQYYFPKLVDIHNYIPASGINQRKSNWETLNRKVLQKLNAQINKSELDQILTGRPGIMENILLKLKQHINTMLQQQNEKNSKRSELVTQGDSIENCPFDVSSEKDLTAFVPAILLADKEKEISFQRENIQTMQDRINRLEELLQLKEQTIQELSNQLSQLKSK